MKRLGVIIFVLTCALPLFGQSVLASGEWWKIEVAETGIYRLTTADINALQGVSVSNIGLYGAGGDMLAESNASTPIDGLHPVAIDIVDHNGNGLMDSGDELIFFGEGAGVWRYNTLSGRWQFNHHAYSNSNYYFLTTTAGGRRIATVESPSADVVQTTYTAVSHVDNDINNIFKTGQVWVGEKFSSSQQSRSFTLTLPGVAQRPLVRYALANVSTARGVFSLSTSGLSRTNTIGADEVYQATMDQLSANGSSFTFDLRYSPGENTGVGYLDYIELNGEVPLQFSGGQMMVRFNGNEFAGGSPAYHTSAVRYSMTGSGNARVWEVTTAGGEREMTVSGGLWSDSADRPKVYAVFDGSSYMHPSSITSVSNQNLQGMVAEYVIVCHPSLRAYADTLAMLHEILDGLATLVVSDVEVFNEFSSGKQDPLAIRAMLRNMKANAVVSGIAPKYLLLLGKASYDPRNLLCNDLPVLVTYESPFSFDAESRSYSSDDMMGYLDDYESGASAESLDISIGRLPAKSVAEAKRMIDKIKGYMMHRDLTDETANGQGDWRNYVALLADDADPSHPYDTAFAHSSEYTAGLIKSNFPNINIDRLYADAYHQQSGAIGSYYPDLNNALRQRINYGCLLLNYIGHGSAKYIGTERYIEPSDISTYTNCDRLPLVVTSTCSYGRQDDPTEMSGAELFMLAENGAVGVVSASRMISHNQRFNTDVILFSLDTANGIGDALRLAKCRTAVPLCIGLIGDPAMRLSIPRNRVVVTHVNHRPVAEGVDDTAKVLSEVTVAGEVQAPDGSIIDDFEGTIYPVVFDREMRTHTLANDNPGTELDFVQQKSMIYKGTAPVSGGRFQYSFIVPRDVAYQYAYGKLSHYASSGGDDASGNYQRILFGGLDENAVIGDARPEIRLFMGDTNFRDGGITDANPTLIALLSDSVGINAAGTGLGHDITAVIDGNPGSLIVLGDLFQPNIDDSRCGTVRYTLEDITPGLHTLTLKAWNIWGNSSTAEISFRVVSSDTLTFSTMSVSPNPAVGQAVFHYETNGTAQLLSAVLNIYSPQGALITSIIPTVTSGSYVVGPVVWNLAGVPPGLYLARMLVTDTQGHTHKSTTKFIVQK